MIERPSDELQRDRQRTLLRNVITSRGPDRGKLVSRLTVRSGNGRAEQLEALTDSTSAGDSVIITSAAGIGFIMVGVSAVGGSDVVE